VQCTHVGADQRQTVSTVLASVGDHADSQKPSQLLVWMFYCNGCVRACVCAVSAVQLPAWLLLEVMCAHLAVLPGPAGALLCAATAAMVLWGKRLVRLLLANFGR
jgi:hypothetical protein